MACFEQSLAALKHLPKSHAAQEQAIDLRFDLRNALMTLGEFRQMLDYLREAEALAKALDDQPRLGRVSAYMCRYFREMGDYDGAVASGQREQSRAELSTAIAMYRAMAMTFWLPQAEVALAQVMISRELGRLREF